MILSDYEATRAAVRVRRLPVGVGVEVDAVVVVVVVVAVSSAVFTNNTNRGLL